MCGPAAPFVMAGLAVMGEIKSQEASMAQAQATNDAFEANQKLQNEAYTKDMEAFWNEEISIQQQAYQNAEDMADEKGLSVISIVHSHPDHPHKPSDFDRDHAWPGFSYIIISVQKGNAVSYRSWQLNQDRKSFSKENIKIVEEK